MGPEFKKACIQLEPTVRLGKLNTESEPNISAQYGIRSIPTMVLFKAGKEVARQSGAKSAKDIVQWVQTHL